MSGEKRFGTSLFGFKKKDVNSYIQKMLHDFNFKIKEKDEEIAVLKNQNKELKEKYEECLKKTEQINEDKNKIADALIIAEEKANLIIEEAKKQAEEEKRSIEEMIEKEKEKLVELKNQIKLLRTEFVTALKKYEQQLNDMEKTGNEQAG